MNLSIDMTRCINDFPYYAANLLKIRSAGQLMPLVLNEPQVRLHRAIEDLQLKGHPRNVLVLKARHEGISTYVEGRIFWHTHMNENAKNIVIAHEKESGASIFEMSRLFYECLPKQYRPMTRYSTKQELVFENPDPKTRYTNPGLRSRLQVYTAGKKNVARGTSVSNLHASEVASWQFPLEVIPSLIPTMPDPNSLVVFESTAKGVGNYFHNEWIRAKAGESNFLAFFLAWFVLPSYSLKFNTTKEKVAFGENLNDEEKELMTKHDLSLEQLYWRRFEIKKLGGDVELFRQEFPATDEEAFIVSGTPVFDRRALRVMYTNCVSPSWRGMVDMNGKLTSDEHGELQLWELPEKDAVYSVGVDVSDGGGLDYSCVEVFKKHKFPLVGCQVAEWHGKIDPYNLAFIVEVLARLYENALVAIEINSYGGMTQQALMEKYWNLYRQENIDRIDVTIGKRFGWETTIRTKRLLVGFMTHCVSNKNVIIKSADLLRECMTFVRDTLNVAGSAAGTGHDDRIMAAMIALFVLHQTFEPLGPPMEDPMIVAKRSLSPSAMVDVEFAEILAYGKDDKYEDTWLNY